MIDGFALTTDDLRYRWISLRVGRQRWAVDR